MTKLTSDQIAFLTAHKIAAEDLFDATEMSKRTREAAMKAAGRRFYYGGTPCDAAGHTLRVRAGHCIQCNTQLIAYARRFSEASRLYVAGSKAGRCIKIGLAADPDDRIKHLTSEAYGGFVDWRILAATKTIESAGRIEAAIQESLARYWKDGAYKKGGMEHKSKELFGCSFAVAVSALGRLMPSRDFVELRCTLQEAEQYQWI